MAKSELREGAMLEIVKDEAIVINRCIAYGKKYPNFNFYPSSNLMPTNRRKAHDIHKRTIKVSIMNIRNDNQSRQWKKVIEQIVSGTCFITSKCYTDMLGISNYYLNVNWSKYFVSGQPNSAYVVPPPNTACTGQGLRPDSQRVLPADEREGEAVLLEPPCQ